MKNSNRKVKNILLFLAVVALVFVAYYLGGKKNKEKLRETCRNSGYCCDGRVSEEAGVEGTTVSEVAGVVSSVSK